MVYLVVGISASGHGLSLDVDRVIVGERPKKSRIVVWEVLDIAQRLFVYLLGRVLVATLIGLVSAVKNLSACLSVVRLMVARSASRSSSILCRFRGRAAGSSLSVRWKNVLYIVVCVVVSCWGEREALVLSVVKKPRVLVVETFRILAFPLHCVSRLGASVLAKFICIVLHCVVSPASIVGVTVRQLALLGRVNILFSVLW